VTRLASRAAVAAAVLALAPLPAVGWGFDAHRIITRTAAEAMPEPLAAFYSTRAARIAAASIEPDSRLRQQLHEVEDRRHYLDLDEISRPPFADIPASEEAARARFGAKALDQAGLLPWRVAEVHRLLRDAFARRDVADCVRLSGWLSHYVADASQPLHTTRNHDGQLTGNQGVHAAFETDLIARRRALYGNRARLPASFAPRPVDDPAAFILAEMVRAHDHVGDVLKADTQAVLLVKRQGKDYVDSLEARAGELAGARMREAAANVASLWHAAWVQAGRPQPPAPATRGRKKAATAATP
jgi:hypothetical protein